MVYIRFNLMIDHFYRIMMASGDKATIPSQNLIYLDANIREWNHSAIIKFLNKKMYRKRLNSSLTFFHTCTSYISEVHEWKKGGLLFKRLRYIFIFWIGIFLSKKSRFGNGFQNTAKPCIKSQGKTKMSEYF